MVFDEFDGFFDGDVREVVVLAEDGSDVGFARNRHATHEYFVGLDPPGLIELRYNLPDTLHKPPPTMPLNLNLRLLHPQIQKELPGDLI